MRAVQVQIVELDVVQPPLAPGGELLLDRLADLADRRLRQRCLWPQRVSSKAWTSRTDKPRTNPVMTGDSRAPVRATPLPSSLKANGSLVLGSLGRARVMGRRWS
jgi:hypothetical protein